MRIAYISSDFGIPVHGNKGASIHVREISSALIAGGHDIEIITCRKGGDAPAGFDVPVHELALGKPEKRIVASLQEDPDASEPIAKAVKSMLYASTLRYQAIPILTTFKPDAIYERYSLLSTAGIDIARELGIPHVLEVNSPLSEEHARYRGSAFPQTIRATEQRILGSTDQVIAVSTPLKQWIVNAGVDAAQVTVVPNGVNVEHFSVDGTDVRSRLGIADRPVVGFVGTLKGWHGIATLIRAVGLLVRERGKEAAPYLLIVGDGPQREFLEAVAHEEGVDDLTLFAGMIPHVEMPAFVNSMDVAVAPYDEMPDFYFSPLKLFEYMAAGRAIVAADIGQVRDIVRDGETGLLYTPGSVGALAMKIRELIDDPHRMMRLGAAARVDVRENHRWERNARIATDLIERERSRSVPQSIATGDEQGGM